MKPLQSTVMPAAGTDGRLRVATYNIHKGVRGLGPAKRLEIHNLCLAVEAFEADVVCLQEVRHAHRGDARRFDRSRFGWPQEGQAEFLAPDGYSVAYRTNAVTRAGEHGNALLSRWPIGDVGHHDVSDHRFEQRGLLWVPVNWPGGALNVIVAHFGLSHTSRVRQAQRLGVFIERELDPAVPLLVAGDFNDWGERLDIPMHGAGLRRASAPAAVGAAAQRSLTFPSLAPVFALDRIYTRGLRCLSTFVPRGTSWARMSDHLPLVAEFELERA
jgi:endonuclease/exonuclease/phosphatase family metal-dependent hydrolase